jgi:vacuolar-type H+-ATPase subunit H
MAAKRKDKSRDDSSEATTKLSHLLETEIELEAMLKATRQEAKQLVEAAKLAADDRVRQFEVELKREDDELRERVARERDRAIDSIQEQSRQETKGLDELDDAKITELARHVIDLLVGRPDSRGPS